MYPLESCSLHLEVDEVLESNRTLLVLFSGHTPEGERYLVRHATGEHRQTWMCAPISERALACVRTGRAELRAAFVHTATGTVDIVTIEPDGHCTESLRLCEELGDGELPPAGSYLGLCA
jgi:hypothetical protein